MKPKQTSVNTFGSFLETLKKQTDVAGSTAKDLDTRILLYLNERRSPVRVLELISDLGIPVTLTVSTLNSLQNLNLVKLSVVGTEDIAEITAHGEQAARLSR